MVAEWLPPAAESLNPRARAQALDILGQAWQSLGDYDRALDFLQQSLAIRREIGDLAGLCPTLFNIGHIQAAKQDLPGALASWLEAYRIARRIGEAQALQALDGLAKELGQDGLGFWEQLANRQAPK